LSFHYYSPCFVLSLRRTGITPQRPYTVGAV
jgi:hypothetical protein